MKTIPQVREELLALAKDLKVSARLQNDDQAIVSLNSSRKIIRLVKSLYRRPAIRRATTESAEATPMLMRRIKSYALSNTSMSYAKIGRHFNVSVGRVSEAVAGKRAA